MQRLLAVAVVIVVLDIIVDQRGLVKRLDGQGNAPDAVR